MKEREIRDIMAGGGGGLGKALRPLMWAISRSYGDLMVLRRWAYRRRVYKSYPVDAPVISVGNLTTGGTGKTPMVAWVAAHLTRMGRSPAVVTRGYKARGGKSDEAEMLERLCDCPIIVNANRVAGARTAIVTGADTIVLDDGFQHRRLRRDLDIVLVDALNPFGYGHCLPRGMLRDRARALREAHAIVITRSDLIDADGLAELSRQIQQLAPAATLHLAIHRPTAGVDERGEPIELEALTGTPALAFCGLGNPNGFFGTLQRRGVSLAGRMEFDDHVDYTAEVVERINQMAEQCDAKILLTTQKDAVKLSGLEFERPLRVLVVEMDVVTGRQELLDRLDEVAPPPAAEASDPADSDFDDE
ncbi:MAG: tetraacyldisaccharide 4'-kinase [Planctomycetota bacterium]|jgi:tetraacyldisaccharide 4'-kinase